MEFPLNYDGLYQAFPQDASAYQGQSPMAGEFEAAGANVDIYFGVDSAQDIAPWCHPSMQRFLKDPQRASLFNPGPQSQLSRVAQPVTAIPPAASHGRQGSPFSSNEPSSCSGARSPPADTELYTEHTPSTPPDMTLFTSYQSAPYETFEPQQQLFLTGTGNFSGDSLPCVSMVDINPSEEIQTEWEDSAPVVDFNSPQRSFTQTSQSSTSTDMDATAPRGAVDNSCQRMASPEEMPTVVKDEIQVPDQTSVSEYANNIYPTPSIGESEDESEGEINVVAPESDDDDDDYRPGKKRAPANSSRRASRPKRDAPKKPLEGVIAKRPRITPAASQPAKILPPPIGGSKGSLTCSECSHVFKDESTLQIHIKKQHTRPFICVFRFAGCSSTFASKNEWKRHVMSQHLLLHYWLCDIDVCADNKNDHVASLPASGKRTRGTSNRRVENAATDADLVAPPLPDGAIFNRKDLYTQHLRRMHTPSNARNAPAAKTSKKLHASSSSSAGSSCTTPSGWDDRIKFLQSQALRERCQLPTYMECPASRCNTTFSGADAWDQRMEHVAKHLEKAATREEPPVVFGGPTDPSLMAWATGPEVAVVRPLGSGRWALNNPLRSVGESRGAAGRKRAASSASTSSVPGAPRALSPAVASVKSEIVVESGDEDAEGEEE